MKLMISIALAQSLVCDNVVLGLKILTSLPWLQELA
jgi:hypothetical protein